MKRREFITVLGGAAAQAQRAPKVARLGVLLFSTPQADPQMKVIHSRLRELGYIEARSLRRLGEMV